MFVGILSVVSATEVKLKLVIFTLNAGILSLHHLTRIMLALSFHFSTNLKKNALSFHILLTYALKYNIYFENFLFFNCPFFPPFSAISHP